MQVKSFGCSYIFGSELADESININVNHPRSYFAGSQLTWPCLVAKNYGYQYNTYARPGSGNLQILERLMSHFAGPVNDDVYCVVGWTWIDRFDYFTESSQWPGLPWSTLMPIDTTETAKIYYRDLHSEIKDKFTNLLYIKQAISLLKEKSIPFIMTYMDHLLFDTRWNTTPAVTELQNYVKSYMTTFDGLNFQEWTKKNNFPISEIGHPLEQAHQSAADYIIQAFDTKSIGVHCHLV
jgi:hypothetical protein